MVAKSSHLNKLLFISLLLILIDSRAGFCFQKEIGGVINKYARVTTITPPDRVIVNDVTNFAAGDTILLIQMQGVEIFTGDGNYGNIDNKLGEPGGYEFLIIQSVINGGTKEIVFRNNILGNYNVNGNLQIVRVPYYNNATVTSKLTCEPWDSLSSKTGGVLALIVGRSLKLNADIDVSGKGFKGGKDTTGSGTCISVSGLASYSRAFHNAGFKGEGIAIHDDVGILLDPDHVLGFGPNYSGGGGGNGRYSGGGGGSNRGLGGIGGFEDATCPDPQQGGLGGRSISSYLVLNNGIFLGGGGGSSTSSGSTATPGGRGGGIVIIVTDTIIGNGRSIKANGANANGGGLNGGSGGGGGGGSVILSLQSYSDKALTIRANGGNGGPHSVYGGGGGGGGGFIWVSTTVAAIPGNITHTTTGGTAGTTASAGTGGETRGLFKAILNGFLFNSIRSSVTGNLVDSICSNVIPKPITGTLPVGGTTPYTYLWKKSYDNISWGYTIPSANSQNYTPTLLESSTVYFKRIVTDAAAVIDSSKVVKIIVQPAITGNKIGKDTIICYNQDPLPIGQLAPTTLGAGNGHYAFLWRDSISNSNARGVNTFPSYDSPRLTQTTFYERIVTSGRCVDNSKAVKITVLDTIRNNKILSLPQEICSGMIFNDLSATTVPTLAGGDNTYKFKWESNINGTGWGVAPGVSNAVGYNPAELPERVPMNEYYFRRIVYSGIHDVCVNTGNSILLKDFPVITNNSISANQSVCSGSAPAKLTGSGPLNGNGTYTYTWQDSTKSHTWTDISGTNSSDYQPPALTDTTRYRRIVFSSVCSDISKPIIVNVHKPVLNNNIYFSSLVTDTTICSGAVPNVIKGSPVSGGTNIPGSYKYLWYYSVDNVTFNPVSTADTTSYYRPGNLTRTTYFKRKATSGQCFTFSSVIIVTVLPPLSDNTISAGQKICINTAPARLTGSVPAGGAGTGSYIYLWEVSADGVVWSSATGPNTGINYQPPAISVPMKYRRKVYSGANDCCSDPMNNSADWVTITLWQDIDSIYAGPDKLLYSFEYVDTLQAMDPPLGSGIWSTVTSSGLPTFDVDTLYNTVVRNMSSGQNIFEWTVSNGTCVKKDRVTIEILELFVPEGFSPNEDAINDEFEIKGLDIGHNTASLVIINAYGSQVYKDDNYKGRWNGFDSNGNELPEGTYYYLITIKSDRIDITKKLSGFIILKR
jgi:gliding motility-associated-like protein